MISIKKEHIAPILKKGKPKIIKEISFKDFLNNYCSNADKYLNLRQVVGRPDFFEYLKSNLSTPEKISEIINKPYCLAFTEDVLSATGYLPSFPDFLAALHSHSPAKKSLFLSLMPEDIVLRDDSAHKQYISFNNFSPAHKHLLTIPIFKAWFNGEVSSEVNDELNLIFSADIPFSAGLPFAEGLSSYEICDIVKTSNYNHKKIYDGVTVFHRIIDNFDYHNTYCYSADFLSPAPIATLISKKKAWNLTDLLGHSVSDLFEKLLDKFETVTIPASESSRNFYTNQLKQEALAARKIYEVNFIKANIPLKKKKISNKI